VSVESGSDNDGGAACGATLRCLAGAVQGFERQPEAAPAFQAPFQRPNARDAPPPEKQRHPGAAGFVRSRAVEHDVAVAWNFPVAVLEFLRENMNGPREHDLFGIKFELMPEIDDDHIFPG
jgi:hypothetical protein